LLKARLAGNSNPRAMPFSSMPPKSPSLAITFPVLSMTTISSSWLEQIQMLSSRSIMIPSGALMPVTKIFAVPALPSGLTGIWMI